MRRILLILIVLISGFQSTAQGTTPSKTVAKHSNSKAYNQSIYNRYKYKNRYTVKQDSAPKHPKKFSFRELLSFKKKEPFKKEPLSRYGNPLEYKVGGRKYEVLKSANGYKARGIASWYGSKFHKQRTSSGEPYDMYVMTAAHRTLPLPTYLKVKNLDNGKTAIVKVNDRGPFHGDRVIDLSYAAALKLGVYPKGTAHVEIETVQGQSSNQAQYYLQTGAFISEASAKQLKDRLKPLTSSSVFVERYQKHYVVRIGPFSDRHQVNNLKTKLAQRGVKGAFSILV